MATLNALIKRVPAYPEAYILLADIYEQQGEKVESVKIYQRALAEQEISPKTKAYIKSRLEAAQNPDKAEPPTLTR